MILKRNEGGIIVILPALSTEAVEFLLPYLVALLVVGLQGCAENCRYRRIVAMLQKLCTATTSNW
nr:hypothetical protein [Prevotella pallens]